MDVPIPEVDVADQEDELFAKRARVDRVVSSAAASSSQSGGGKRKHCGPAGDEARAEDPEDPVDSGEMGSFEDELLSAPRVFMLGDRRSRAGKLGEGLHPGKHSICELFSPPRVVSVALANGLRGGWSLDLNHRDPVTGSEWDLSNPAARAKVWKMVRRDKPLVVGLSPGCTLFRTLQNLR